MTVAEIEELRKEWVGNLKEDNVSVRTTRYITSLVDYVLEQKSQVA